MATMKKCGVNLQASQLLDGFVCTIICKRIRIGRHGMSYSTCCTSARSQTLRHSYFSRQGLGSHELFSPAAVIWRGWSLAHAQKNAMSAAIVIWDNDWIMAIVLHYCLLTWREVWSLSLNKAQECLRTLWLRVGIVEYIIPRIDVWSRPACSSAAVFGGRIIGFGFHGHARTIRAQEELAVRVTWCFESRTHCRCFQPSTPLALYRGTSSNELNRILKLNKDL